MTRSIRSGIARFCLAVPLATLAVAGCGKSRSGLISEYVQACMEQGGHSSAVCECAGRHADNELTPASLELLVVTLQGKEKRAARLRDRTGVREAVAAGTFMVDGPARCEWEVGAR